MLPNEILAKIIIGDRRQMKDIFDETIDLIVTLPPYWYRKTMGFLGRQDMGKLYMSI